MFIKQQSNENRVGRHHTRQAFFQPRPAATPVHRKETEPGTVDEFQDHCFFKPNRPADNLIQRIPIPNSNPASAQPASPAQQPQTALPSETEIQQGAVISRAGFVAYVTQKFGVLDVHIGTKTEQESSLTGRNSVLPTIPAWAEWSPGDSSKDYSLIIKAVQDVAGRFSAIPAINIIKFYKTYYETNTAGVAIPQANVGASFGAGVLTIYQAFASGGGFPVERSNAKGNYPKAPVAAVSSGSNPDGAPVPYQGHDANAKQNIVHELGHGIAEAAHASDPDIFIKFNSAIGWIGTSSPELYDIGQPEVQKAIQNGHIPDAKYNIKPTDWNAPKWKEQPMSGYSVEGGPGEDFAECIAAFTYANDSLKARSPKRFKFITDGMPKWTTKMQAIPLNPKGDFPVNEQMKHTA